MKKFAVLAALLIGAAIPAQAGDVGGAIGGFNMSSFAAGGTVAGNVGGAGLLGTGSINSTFTQSAHNDQLAGTLAKFEKLPGGFTASIVSEVSGNSWSSQTMTGAANGFAGQLNLGAGVGLGGGVSGGELGGIMGYANW